MSHIDLNNENREDSSVATLAEVDAGPQCEKCELTLHDPGMAACPRCGYYPSLGIYVEVDPWEGNVHNPEVASRTQPSHWEVWSRLIPAWGWKLIATTFAIVIASVAVRVLLAGSPLRTTWSVTQLLGGMFLAILCHVTAFVWMLSSDFDMGLMDLVLKPIKIWTKTCRELPKRFWLLNSVCGGVTAALCAALIIGAIPYERLLDWGFKQPPKQNLMGAMMEQAQKVKGDDKSLEEAVEDFAGTAGTPENKVDPSKAATRLNADCVIIGYTPQQSGQAVQLWLASEFRGKLVYIGRVTPRLGAQEIQELLTKLGESRSARAFVFAPGEPLWVRPALTCRISYVKRDASGRMTDIQWGELLGEVKLPW